MKASLYHGENIAAIDCFIYDRNPRVVFKDDINWIELVDLLSDEIIDHIYCLETHSMEIINDICDLAESIQKVKLITDTIWPNQIVTFDELDIPMIYITYPWHSPRHERDINIIDFSLVDVHTVSVNLSALTRHRYIGCEPMLLIVRVSAEWTYSNDGEFREVSQKIKESFTSIKFLTFKISKRLESNEFRRRITPFLPLLRIDIKYERLSS
jgi:hypothetical protein